MSVNSIDHIILGYMTLTENRHTDSGFGYLAEKYHRAASILHEKYNIKPKEVPFSVILPLLFLYRHAIELYLKSLIIIMRGKKDSKRQIKKDSLFNEHGVVKLTNVLINEFQKNARTKNISKYLAISQKLLPKLHKLNTLDPSGDYFKYPFSKRSSKDAMKRQWQIHSKKYIERKKRIKFSELFGNQISTYRGNKLHSSLKVVHDIAYDFFKIHYDIRVSSCNGF